MKKLISETVANVKSKDIVEGISSKWFMRHFPIIVIGIFFSLAYISMRFDCITAMETMKHLQNRIETVRTETRRERAHYMSTTSESNMLRRVDTLQLGLHLQERPPYTITVNR